jgi:hypothetical protein
VGGSETNIICSKEGWSKGERREGEWTLIKLIRHALQGEFED